jgi:hypothetical protein
MAGPQDCQTDVLLDLSNLDAVCALMPSRLVMTGALVQWMRTHFTDPDNITNPFIREYLWTDEIETNKILIDSVFKYQPAVSEFRPGIFVKPGAWKFLNSAIDNRHMVRRGCAIDP